ncbi:kunitz-type protease inhibitor 3 isoform X1 [Bubalus kerabau]|uniref:colostrum trypsin inhibitor isoform X1 n=1 Tax=Bubalus bubalis TaxID=89462 RepID=UPI000DBC5B04|nr:colostrum trypsin inhibitor isoform X1 [Bubalus bubalis]XP_055401090.1 colostrum trypsin inhibitor isoform X1 [Bubalus carabanensis]
MKLSCLLALCLTLCLVGLASSGETSDNLKQEASQDLFQTPPDLCQLPQARGPCKAALLRYFYNSTSNACEPFSYGGCQGNDNNFETTEMCLRICQPPGLRRSTWDRHSSLHPAGPLVPACGV